MAGDTMKWERTASRVHGNGVSYNCTNTVTATDLQNRLNQYEHKITELQTQIKTDNNITKINQQLIILQMDLKVVQNDINIIKELLE